MYSKTENELFSHKNEYISIIEGSFVKKKDRKRRNKLCKITTKSFFHNLILSKENCIQKDSTEL